MTLISPSNPDGRFQVENQVTQIGRDLLGLCGVVASR
jgi:hypothetical protein